MTAIEDRPGIAERYARALESSHLEVKTDERCSVDYLIAAGWVDESLGTLLFRLRAEFDGVRAEQRLAERNLLAAQALAAQLPSEFARDWAQRSAEEAALTERALILVHLKTLHVAKAALGRHASILATKTRFMQDDAAVMRIAGRALDAWLDPLCPRCNGTGQIGAYGEPRSICTACHGAKLRSMRLANDEAGHQFGLLLMGRMDSKCDYVAARMRRFLSQRGG